MMRSVIPRHFIDENGSDWGNCLEREMHLNGMKSTNTREVQTLAVQFGIDLSDEFARLKPQTSSERERWKRGRE
jgi:hypothetical protein